MEEKTARKLTEAINANTKALNKHSEKIDQLLGLKTRQRYPSGSEARPETQGEGFDFGQAAMKVDGFRGPIPGSRVSE